MEATTRNQVITHLILFCSLALAMFLALLAPQWIQTTAGAWIIGIVGLVFVATLLVLTSIASFGDSIPGNTFSELLRESTLNSTFYPWALSVYMGRWFHPVDGLESPLGLFGPVLLMALTWGIIVLGDVLRKKGKRIWPWLIVALGFATGIITWPA
ncbi:MAG TPA: hypothetical protein ENN42_09650 [Thioalkalivibrio sp.]|nr:hypothetical protein [Thioalkalivibrio sp.]